MKLYFKFTIILAFFAFFAGCGGDETENKNNFQFYADKEKELNDREARLMLKERELEERENKLNMYELGPDITDTTQLVYGMEVPDSTVKPVNNQKIEKKKKEIQKEMNRKFENPVTTVKDYFEYIQRGVNEEGNFDANMSKAQKLFPARSVDKLKGTYRKTKKFTVVQEPKLKSQKEDKSVIVAKVKQIEVINKKEVTKNLTVTYNLTANENGQWVISSATVKAN